MGVVVVAIDKSISNTWKSRDGRQRLCLFNSQQAAAAAAATHIEGCAATAVAMTSFVT